MDPKEREKFITDNHNLIYKFIHKHNLDLEDNYDLLAIALIKAFDTYEANKNIKFSTYAFKVMRNKYLNELRKRRRDSLNYAVSIEKEVCENMPLIDTLESEEVIKDLCALKTPGSLTNKERLVFSYYLKGYSIMQTARILGVSHQCIEQTIRRIRDKYKRVNGR